MGLGDDPVTEEYFRGRFGTKKTDMNKPPTNKPEDRVYGPRISSDLITALESNQVFVFGSNKAGRHGKGAARVARRFGAEWGEGEGHHGQTYGIPTKDERLLPMKVEDIARAVQRFIAYATRHPEVDFLVTEVGCGLAGFSPAQIAPMFKAAQPLTNVYLPRRFCGILYHTEGK